MVKVLQGAVSCVRIPQLMKKAATLAKEIPSQEKIKSFNISTLRTYGSTD